VPGSALERTVEAQALTRQARFSGNRRHADSLKTLSVLCVSVVKKPSDARFPGFGFPIRFY
jgi:hypothetical protein